MSAAASDTHSDQHLEDEKVEVTSKGTGDTEKATPPAQSAPSGPPDGGAQAWLTVAGASACLFCSFGWINAIGIFQEYYQTHQLRDYSASEIAWIPSLQIFFMLIGGLPAGKMFDDYGPRIPLLVGSFLHVFGLMMTSISTEYYQFLLSQGVCSALGASFVFNPAFTCAAGWFDKKRGAALGIVAAGSSLGGVIFPIMVIQLIPQVGFGWTIRICAFLILALLAFANLSIASRIQPKKRPFSFMAFIRPQTELTFGLFTIAAFFFYWGMFIPFTFIVTEAVSKGMSPTMAQYLVPILNGASIIGRTVPNALADKFGFFNVMIIMATFSTIITLGLWLPANGNAPLIVYAALFGIGSGAGIGLTPAIATRLSKLHEIGVRVGSVMAFASIAALTGSPIGGAIIGASGGGYTGTIVFGGVSLAIATSFYTAARFSHSRERKA